MYVLVTGGAGYIGSHAAKQLFIAGHVPVVIDNLSTGHRETLKWGHFRELDVADRTGLEAVFREYPIEAVMHFAASTYVAESFADPTKYFTNNVVNFIGLLDVMCHAQVKMVVLSSSCAAYGPPLCAVVGEDHRLDPISPYGTSKLMAEQLLTWYGKIHSFKWVALRYFNAAGADLDGDLGELHDPEPHLIPRAIGAALGRLAVLDIYGTDYPTADGTAIRDYVHVNDLAVAHIRALEYLAQGGISSAFNLGSGRGYSVRQIISEIERCTNRRVPIHERGRRPGDPAIIVANTSRAFTSLGWCQKQSDLSTLVKSAWDWQRNRCHY